MASNLNISRLSKRLFAVNADTLVVVTNMLFSLGQTYVRGIASSNTETSAKKWSAAIMRAIVQSKMVSIY